MPMITCLVCKGAQLRIKSIAIAVLFACSALTFLACEFTDPKYRGSGPPILQIGGQAARISAGRDHSCILQEDGSPVCWGIQGLPHHATVSPDVRLTTISSGRGHVCGLMEDVDAGSFNIVAESGQLQTQAALDYETRNRYTVTVTASDGTLTATVHVTVTVTYIDEAGTVTLSTNQLPARAEITAALTDPDKGVTGTVWQWERSSDRNTDWAGIGTGSPSYTPVDGDVGYHLRATASYADGHGPGKTAQAASTLAVQAGANRPPKFDPATATREVPENTEAGRNIGAPVTANDPDTGDTLTYTLEGPDADSFDIDSASGQIQTKSGVTYDHESKSSYSVTVKADDNNGGTDTIDVTITVADVNEPPEFSVETASRTIAENTTTGVAIGAPTGFSSPTRWGWARRFRPEYCSRPASTRAR